MPRPRASQPTSIRPGLHEVTIRVAGASVRTEEEIERAIPLIAQARRFVAT